MIEFDNVTVRFGDNTVLDGVSFRLPAEKISFIIGGSGSGKSTILRAAMGFIRPDAGRIIIDGDDVTGASERELHYIRKKMGMVFQGSALFDSLNAFENVGFYPIYREHARPREVARRVREILGELDLSGIEKLYPSELSGGMKRRVALARALIYHPKILLYDEPTTGLDPVTLSLVDNVIAQTNAKFKVTSIVVSHDVASVLNIGDYVVFIADGKAVEIGQPENLFKSSHAAVREFAEGVRILARAAGMGG